VEPGVDSFQFITAGKQDAVAVVVPIYSVVGIKVPVIQLFDKRIKGVDSVKGVRFFFPMNQNRVI
jgi:hypothetical protein